MGSFFLILFFLFWKRILPISPGCLKNHRDTLASTSWVLGLKMYASKLSSFSLFLLNKSIFFINLNILIPFYFTFQRRWGRGSLTLSSGYPKTHRNGIESSQGCGCLLCVCVCLCVHHPPSVGMHGDLLMCYASSCACGG